MINIPKGTKDVLPKDSYKWQYIESVARKTAKEFAVSEIRTPTFEHTEVFLRGVGNKSARSFAVSCTTFRSLSNPSFTTSSGT